MFDDNKRLNLQSKSKNYNDAKPSFLSQDELLFEGKSRSEFERVKQKFDSRHSNKSYNYGSQIPSSSKNSSRKSTTDGRHSQKNVRSTDASFDESNNRNNMNINDTIQFFDVEKSTSFQNQIQGQHTSFEKQDNTVDLGPSFNLDGFKVSEDDDDDVSICGVLV